MVLAYKSQMLSSNDLLVESTRNKQYISATLKLIKSLEILGASSLNVSRIDIKNIRTW